MGSAHPVRWHPWPLPVFALLELVLELVLGSDALECHATSSAVVAAETQPQRM